MVKTSPLLDFLAEGESRSLDRFSPEELSLLLAEARSGGLLNRLTYNVLSAPSANIPRRIAVPLESAAVHTEGFIRDVRRELAHIEQALSALKIPVILLKGASYVHLGLPAANGRFFSDIDILVAREHLPATEAALMLGGWSAGKLNAYDQRYYRQWSHEIPPMTHIQRGTTIDLHHALAMPTCRIKIDSARMVSEAIPADEKGFWWRLKDVDVVLHAASHLLLNSEFDRGLRDIWDIDLLFRHFSARSADFPHRLLARAKEIGLEDIIRCALALSAHFLRTPIPEFLKPPPSSSLTQKLLTLAATTRHPDTRPAGQEVADFALLLREMYLRFQGKILARHLLHKALSPFAMETQKKMA